jgi:DNA-binding PadR family transcriptional regulator
MDEEGLVRSNWQPSSRGPARRTYTLTGEGHEWLHAMAGILAEAQRALNMFHRRYVALDVALKPGT